MHRYAPADRSRVYIPARNAVRIPTMRGLERHHGVSRFLLMATHRVDVSVLVGVAVGSPVCVPDVVMLSEGGARHVIEAAGLVPGHRDPAPRPVNGRSEVVVRTHPRRGSLAPAGSRVDYDLAPGEPSAFPRPGAYVDYDAIDTLIRAGRRPLEVRA